MVSPPLLIIALWTVLFAICSGQPVFLPYNQRGKTLVGPATITATAIDTKTTQLVQRVSVQKSPTVESSKSEFNANQDVLNRQLPGDSVSYSVKLWFELRPDKDIALSVCQILCLQF